MKTHLHPLSSQILTFVPYRYPPLALKCTEMGLKPTLNIIIGLAPFGQPPRLFFHLVTWVPKPGANQKSTYLNWYRRQYQPLIGTNRTVRVNSATPVFYPIHHPNCAITVYLPANLTVLSTSIPVVPAANTIHKPGGIYHTAFGR